MRKYETYTEEVKRTECVEVTCDICGTKGIRDSWESGCYEINETNITVTVHAKKGMSYPDDYYGDQFIIDMCPKCFRDKLIPWINSQGGNVLEQKYGS